MLWTSGVVSNTGTWMQAITVPFAVDHLTHSTAMVGLSAFLMYFPLVLVAPLAGSLADRYSRRTVLLWSQGVMMLMALSLWALWASGAATAANLLACVVVSAVANGMTQPSWRAFVIQLVPRRDLVNAVHLDVMANQAAKAFGPGLAGLVLATLGPGPAFLLNGLSFALILVVLFIIPSRATGDAGPSLNVFRHFAEAVRFVRGRQVLAVVMGIEIVFAFLGASVQLAEPFARRVLDVGGGAYGILVAAYGIGALVASFIAVWGRYWPRSRLIFVSMAGFVAAQVAFGLSTSFAFALVGITMLGLTWVVSQVSFQTTVQANVDEAHRGRVLAIYFGAFFAGAPLGALVGGIAGDLFGLRATFLVGAGLLGAFLLVTAFRYDRYRLFDQSLEHDDHALHRENTAAEI